MKPASKNHEQELKIEISFLGVLSFLCGLTNDMSFGLVGELFLVEPLLLLLAIMLLLIRGSGGAFKVRIFWGVVFTGFVMLLGYMASDLYMGTLPSQYMRGWGRIVILISNCIALMVLTAHNRQNLWWFMLGTGIGGVAFLASQGVPVSIWKLGYGERIGIIILTLAPLFPKWFAIFSFIAFGALCTLLDYRNLGAAFLVVAAILWARSRHTDKLVPSFAQYARLVLFAGIGVIVLATATLLTQDEYGARRYYSNMSRTAALRVAVQAIADSPIIGYGSWTESQKYAEMLLREIRENKDPNNPVAPEYMGNQVRSHSQILQAWIEGGFFGAFFFFFYGYQLMRANYLYILWRPVDVYFPAFLFTVVIGLWNWVASPFLGSGRIQIAMAIAVIADMAIRKIKRPQPLDPVSNKSSMESVGPRSLVAEKIVSSGAKPLRG